MRSGSAKYCDERVDKLEISASWVHFASSKAGLVAGVGLIC